MSNLKGGSRDNLKLGSAGENIAKKYLQDKGFRVIEQNYKTKYAEIDLVAKCNSGLVFVEVRTRSGEQFGLPEESLNKKKLRRLVRAARAYTCLKNYRGAYRIDAVCIVLDKTPPSKVSGGSTCARLCPLGYEGIPMDKDTNGLKRIDHYENITD
ncbi:MAG: YraN family protein [Candidatus Omnitrophica bacterium]|nr:YraN family protein [Candidatus Omnitrophota bacterium]MBU1134376.1 YraN family protein [Candidatus Omnitrophota bacterium]